MKCLTHTRRRLKLIAPTCDFHISAPSLSHTLIHKFLLPTIGHFLTLTLSGLSIIFIQSHFYNCSRKCSSSLSKRFVLHFPSFQLRLRAHCHTVAPATFFRVSCTHRWSIADCSVAPSLSPFFLYHSLLKRHCKCVASQRASGSEKTKRKLFFYCLAKLWTLRWDAIIPDMKTQLSLLTMSLCEDSNNLYIMPPQISSQYIRQVTL